MKLSKAALQILNSPMEYLDIEHTSKKAINPSNIWMIKQPECSREDFINALKLIRQVASKRGRGVDEAKAVVHNSIESYVLQVWDRFRNVNQLNYHLKGLYGCELPRQLRDRVFNLYKNKKVRSVYEKVLSDDVEPTQEATPTQTIETPPLTFTFNGVSITLSSGASLNIGELETKTLDFKGLKSVTIEKVEGGKLYGVSLEA